VLGSTAALTVAGMSRGSFGQPAGALRAPVVDSLAVQIVTDNS
jgi:hypothetical protein